MKKRTRIVLTAALFIICVACLCLAGCKGKEPIYKTRFCFSLISAPYETDGSISGCLTEEEPYYEADAGVYPFNTFHYSPCIHVADYSEKYGEVPYIAFSTHYPEEDIEGFELTYTIEKDGKVENAEYEQNFYSDMYYRNREDTVTAPFSELEHKPGKHRLHFSIPSIQPYNTKPVEFEIVFNIAEDTRTGKVEFYIENTGNIQYFCSAEETGSLDFYVMNRKPEVAVKEIGGKRISGINPNTGLRCRSFESGGFSGISSIHNIAGYYICRANFDGDEDHPAQYYEFYLLLID